MDFIPRKQFDACVCRYDDEHKMKSFSCRDQYHCMAFAQLTCLESLRDIEICLRTQPSKLYHMDFSSIVARNTLANANAVRDWRIYSDFAQALIRIARPLYRDEPFDVDLDRTFYAFNATTIDFFLSIYPWASFRSTKDAIKLQKLLDLRGNIPNSIHISDVTLHNVYVLDELIAKPGAFYIMDRAYVDFYRLHHIHLNQAVFVTRTKSNMAYRRHYSRTQ